MLEMKAREVLEAAQRFQPFLRFYPPVVVLGVHVSAVIYVSTLLEILQRPDVYAYFCLYRFVSTLLEILLGVYVGGTG